MTVAFLYLRITLGLLFLVAGFSKTWDRRAFQIAVASFQIVPSRLAPAAAVAIVSLELAGAGLLLAGGYEWLGALLLCALLAAFNVALVANLLRGRRNLDCQCFGQQTLRIGWGHVAQNTLMLAMALLIGLLAVGRKVSPHWGDPTIGSFTILAAAYSVVLFLAAQELVSVRAGLLRVLTRRVQAG